MTYKYNQAMLDLLRVVFPTSWSYFTEQLLINTFASAINTIICTTQRSDGKMYCKARLRFKTHEIFLQNEKCHCEYVVLSTV